MTGKRPRKVVEVLQAAADYLARKRVESPRLACELLASRLLACKRLELYLRFDQPLTDRQLEAMRRGVKRVAAGEPVQYVVGQVDFMGHTFKVDKRALIPRPETEVLVEQALAVAGVWAAREQGGPVVVDVGTGCGCVVVSLALARAAARFLAIDTSPAALELAEQNAETHGVADRIGFSQSELSDLVDADTLDAIVANLPYVRTADYEKLPPHVREHEPRLALDGGADGLDIIRTVIADAGIALKPDGYLFLEIGADQSAAVEALAAEAGFGDVRLAVDLAGRERVLIAGGKH